MRVLGDIRAMWLRLIRTAGIGAIIITTCSAFKLNLDPALGMTSPNAEEKITEVGIFKRPTIGDVKQIDDIAASGAALTLNFKAGADIARFVAKKCGLPSVTMLIHPEFERLLIARNAAIRLTHEDLTNLRSASHIEIPACAKFAKQVEDVVVPASGIRYLSQDLSIPFDYETFANTVKNDKIREDLSAAVAIARTTGRTERFQRIAGTICGNAQASLQLDSFDRYLSCINAMTIVGANPEIKDPTRIGSHIRVPIAGKLGTESTGEDIVPLKPVPPLVIKPPVFDAKKVEAPNVGIAISKAARNTGETLRKSATEIGEPIGKEFGDTGKEFGRPIGKNAELDLRPFSDEIHMPFAQGGDFAVFGDKPIVAPGSGVGADVDVGSPDLGGTPDVEVGSPYVEFRPIKEPTAHLEVPKVPAPVTQQVETQIALATPSSVLVPANPSIRGLIKRQHTLDFILDLTSAAQYPNCANAGDLNPGAWPFDVKQFERAARLSDIEQNPQKGKILVADTGFDFVGDESDDPKLLQLTKDIFQRAYFHVLDKKRDPNPDQDRNHDGVYGNGGWAGVNLAADEMGGLSAKTNIDYPDRGHGLSVTTLAMGGKEELRSLNKLQLEIGEVSLVPMYDNPYLASTFVANTIKYAQADGNNFDVINFSLSSEVNDGTWNSLLSNSKDLVLVVAAGNDGKELTDKGVWPAAYGGGPVTDDPTATVFITVGAHDGKGKFVSFSNWGAGVDILAPGCAVPSYALKIGADDQIVGITDQAVTGTSAAAPLVSFVAGLLAGNYIFHDNPGAIKIRILVGSDYDSALKTRAFSTGILNIAKVIGFRYDVLEVLDKDKPAVNGHQPHKLRYGTVTIKAPEEFKCGYEPPLSFTSIKKIARGKVSSDPILVLATDDPTRQMKLTRHFCPPDALNGMKMEFHDIETNTTEPIDINDVWDYIARNQ